MSRRNEEPEYDPEPGLGSHQGIPSAGGGPPGRRGAQRRPPREQPRGEQPHGAARSMAGAGGVTMLRQITALARRIAGFFAECNYAQRRMTMLRTAPDVYLAKGGKAP